MPGLTCRHLLLLVPGMTKDQVRETARRAFNLLQAAPQAWCLRERCPALPHPATPDVPCSSSRMAGAIKSIAPPSHNQPRLTFRAHTFILQPWPAATIELQLRAPPACSLQYTEARPIVTACPPCMHPATYISSHALQASSCPAPLQPCLQEYVQQYCEASGCAPPSPTAWAFYMALSLFRLLAIIAGVQARAKQVRSCVCVCVHAHA